MVFLLIIKNNLQRTKYNFIAFICFEVMVCAAFIMSIAGSQANQLSTYARKTDLSELLVAITSYKAEITTEYLESGKWPAKRRLDDPKEKYNSIIDRVEFDGFGAINFYLNGKYPDLERKVLSFSVTLVSNVEMSSILWVCGYATAPDGFEKVANNITDIEPDYLPKSCK